MQAFKIVNKYDNDQFISFMTPSADVLEVRMPTSQIKLKMVATQAEAVDQFQFSSSNMALLFGTVPTGKDNALYKKQAATGAKPLEEVLGSNTDDTNSAPEKEMKPVGKKAAAPPENLKQRGVPGGKGIMVKSKLPPASAPASPPVIPATNPAAQPGTEEKSQ